MNELINKKSKLSLTAQSKLALYEDISGKAEALRDECKLLEEDIDKLEQRVSRNKYLLSHYVKMLDELSESVEVGRDTK